MVKVEQDIQKASNTIIKHISELQYQPVKLCEVEDILIYYAGCRFMSSDCSCLRCFQGSQNLYGFGSV